MFYKNEGPYKFYQTTISEEEHEKIYSIILPFIKNNDRQFKKEGFEPFERFGGECSKIIHYKKATSVIQVHLGSRTVKIQIAGEEKARKEIVGKLEKITGLKFEGRNIFLDKNS